VAGGIAVLFRADLEVSVTAPGAVIGGRYRLVRRIGDGGMGSVWEGWDEVLHRAVAVKQLLSQPGLRPAEAEMARSRAMREARITARLHHPNAVAVYDVVDQDGQPCLIMQYLPSTSLRALLMEQGVLPPAAAARMGAEVAGALAAAHEAGIVHRDVKPGNVLITEDGTAKLTDFGVSHAVGDVSLTSTGMVTGTPAFLAPEVARGTESTFASDVFSLGATLYAALEGDPPFGNDPNPMAVLHKVASGQIIPPKRSGALAPLLTRMLAPDPADRPSMLHVKRTLEALHGDLAGEQHATQRLRSGGPPANRAQTLALPVVAQSPGTPPEQVPAERSGRRGALVLLALAGLLVAALVLGLLLLRDNGNNNAGKGTPGSTVTRSHSSPATTPQTSTPATSSAASSTAASTTASTTAATSSPPRSSPASSTAPAGIPTAAELARAITDYYGLLPGGTDQAWARLTPRYQSGTAQNRQTYQAFWDSIQRVSVADATGQPPGSVTATITYNFKDGRVTVERTAYGLVKDAGVLKIDSSQVLSSQTR
jgi:serine/threonine protein kinase